MQQLHLVGFTTDQRGLIFSVRRGAKSGGYMIHLDASLVTAVEELQALIAEETAAKEEATAVQPESSLSVREVQARLRRGRTIDQVAKEAGVDASWVARFAVPVLAEQAEVIRAARATKMIKQRVIVSGAALGDAVYRNLADRGITDPRDRLDRNWRARQLTEGAWLVTFTYTVRGRASEAAWEYDSATGTLKARGRLGTQLGFREPRRAPRPPATAKAVKKAQPTKKAATSARRSAARSTKRVAAARTAATSRMVTQAERATRRNAALARKAAKKTLGLPLVRFEPLPPLPDPEPEPLLVEEETESPKGWADELVLEWTDDEAADETADEAADEAQDEVDEEFEEGPEEEPRPSRREPLRAQRVVEPDEPVRPRVRVRTTLGEMLENAGNGPVFRSDLARPASEQPGQARYATPSPSDPLSIPVPIDRPPRRRRRPLRGR